MTNILVIDDCEVFRELLGMVLEDSGHNHIEANSLTEALETLKQEDIDLVFCDLMMPTEYDGEFTDDSAMVGVSTMKEIRRRYPDIPIVAISGKMSHQPLQGLTQFGADAGICKPFKQESLLNLIEDLTSSQEVST